MGLLDDLGGYLDTQLGSLTAGTNLFYGRLPDDPDVCVALVEYGGEPPVSVMGATVFPVVEQPRLQVLTRAAGYASASSLAVSVWAVFEGVVNSTIGSTRYHRVAGLQNPFPLERDSQDRVVFAQNFKVSRE